MDVSIALAIGGLAGSLLRVVVTQDQDTFSKKSVADVVVGGAVGLLYPLYPVIELPAGASILQQAALVGVISYLTGDFVQSIVGRFGSKK